MNRPLHWIGPVLVVGGVALSMFAKGFGWVFWVVFVGIFLSGIPVRHTVRQRRASNAAVAVPDSPSADPPLVSTAEPAKTEQVAKSIGLGG